MVKAKLRKRHHEAENIITFWFETDQPMNYLPGQYIEMFIPRPNPDDRGIKRWFTLSSSPTDAPLISITTKFSLKGSSFKTKLYDLRIGDTVDISEPMGDFVLPKDASIQLNFIAGGIGITPFHSIIKYLVDNGEDRDITLIYSAKNEQELIFTDLFNQSTLINFVPIIKEPKEWTGQTGTLDGKRILGLIGDYSNGLIYISGPEPMVESFDAELIKLGVPKNQLVGDYFPGYTQL